MKASSARAIARETAKILGASSSPPVTIRTERADPDGTDKLLGFVGDHILELGALAGAGIWIATGGPGQLVDWLEHELAGGGAQKDHLDQNGHTVTDPATGQSWNYRPVDPPGPFPSSNWFVSLPLVGGFFQAVQDKGFQDKLALARGLNVDPNDLSIPGAVAGAENIVATSTAPIASYVRQAGINMSRATRAAAIAGQDLEAAPGKAVQGISGGLAELRRFL